MKGNALRAAVAAGLVASAASANAVELSPDGTGQVLIYPYYTVNRNQQTIISVVNATNVAKAVRVRFLEGYNAREVMDFNLFLSDFDVWTASIFALSDAGLTGDGAAIMTTDRSCTAPGKDYWTGALGTGRPYNEFRMSAFTGARADSGPTDVTRTREGHIELVQMADLGGPLRTAVTHTAAGTPANCQVIQSIDPAHTALLPPTGGLFGAGGIVNVAQGTFHAYNADAIGGFSKVVLFAEPGMPTPSLAQTNTAPGVATAFTFDAAGELFRSDYVTTGQPSQAVDAVSALFMASYLLNEYNVDASAGSNTDWVVTFPTKRFYVDPEILGLPLRSAGALPPFTYTFGERSVVNGTTYNGDAQSCSRVDVVPFDREEGRPVGPAPGFPPVPPVLPTALCRSVNVVSMLYTSATEPPAESAVLGSRLHDNARPFSAAGWMRLSFDPSSQPHALRASRDGDVFRGLPATGFQAVNYVNSNVVAGVLANYSAAFRHRAVRTCVNGTSSPCN
ncbi:MAG TPA: hypothetical protein VLF18_19670 [Tahibacter sp.]|uniref:hypothetical protein n=1 Tax=Tahibacter sp. TaxID=2056211 RepID=UPI002CDCA55F|nr:hypothetical protein [Tahibacter sp.]HSX62409.1 hypothetical protein [Tahibacter sp.]